MKPVYLALVVLGSLFLGYVLGYYPERAVCQGYEQAAEDCLAVGEICVAQVWNVTLELQSCAYDLALCRSQASPPTG